MAVDAAPTATVGVPSVGTRQRPHRGLEARAARLLEIGPVRIQDRRDDRGRWVCRGVHCTQLRLGPTVSGVPPYHDAGLLSLRPRERQPAPAASGG